MKKLLISLVTVGAVAGIGFYATNAYFSDKETSTGNTFQAGSLDLKVDSKCHYDGMVCGVGPTATTFIWREESSNSSRDPSLLGQPCSCKWLSKDLTPNNLFFNFADVKPGDDGQENVSLRVDNNDAWGCVTITPTANDENVALQPELLAGDAADIPGNLFDGELAQSMFFHIFADMDNSAGFSPGDNIFNPPGDKDLYNNTGITSPITIPLADSTHNNIFTGNPGPLQGNTIYYIGSYWKIDSSIGNIIQTDKYTADISFYTEQFRNNPNFQCSLR